MTLVVVIGALLGVISRLEETAGLSVGVSSNATWLAAAFAAGATRSASGPGAAALAGGLILTAANAAYYAWIGLTEPGAELASVAGAPAMWFVLGISGGMVYAASARAWSRSTGVRRVAASLPLAGICIADGIAHGDRLSGAVIAAAGFAFPIGSAQHGSERRSAGLVSAMIVAIALAGQFDPLLP